MKILILGSTGMLGHTLTRYFKIKGYDVIETSRTKESKLYFDAMDNYKSLEKIIEEHKPNVVINCIGILNKDAEEHKATALLINSFLPHYIDELSEKYSFKFIHISTDCVFDGKKGSYNEYSEKDAKSFYGLTKGLGEIDNDRNVTLRTSIVGPDINKNGIGLFQWFMNQKENVKGFSEVIWTGVTTIELSKQIEVAIERNLTGLFHVVNGRTIDKYSLLNLFKNNFNSNIEIIIDDSYKSNKSLIITRKDFKFDISSYEDMVEEMRNWIIQNPDLYNDIYPQLFKKDFQRKQV